MTVAAAASTNPGGIILGFALILLGIAAWWLPTIIAWRRRVPNLGSVAVIDGLLAWTMIGWVVALAMACRSRPPAAVPVVPYGMPMPPPDRHQQYPPGF